MIMPVESGSAPIEIAGKIGNPFHSERTDFAYPGRHGMEEAIGAFRVHADLGGHLGLAFSIEAIRALDQGDDLRQLWNN